MLIITHIFILQHQVLIAQKKWIWTKGRNTVWLEKVCRQN